MTIPQSRIDAAREACAKATEYTDIVFDGPPEHVAGRFVEVENANGQSVSLGEWIHRDDGYWVLRFKPNAELPAFADALEAAKARIATLEDELHQQAINEVENAQQCQENVNQLVEETNTQQARIEELEAARLKLLDSLEAANRKLGLLSEEIRDSQVEEDLK